MSSVTVKRSRASLSIWGTVNKTLAAVTLHTVGCAVLTCISLILDFWTDSVAYVTNYRGVQIGQGCFLAHSIKVCRGNPGPWWLDFSDVGGDLITLSLRNTEIFTGKGFSIKLLKTLIIWLYVYVCAHVYSSVYKEDKRGREIEIYRVNGKATA